MGVRRLTATLAVLTAVVVPAASASAADPLAPPAPTSVTGPPSPGTDTTPAWTWDVDLLATYECHFEKTGDPVVWQACASGDPFTTAGDGPYSFGVRALV